MSDTVFQAFSRWAMCSSSEATEVLFEYLGIDPDMPVETLRKRLLWGERVEDETHLRQVRTWGRYDEGWDELLAVLTRDNPPPPAA